MPPMIRIKVILTTKCCSLFSQNNDIIGGNEDANEIAETSAT